MTVHPLIFEPIYKPKIWGGDLIFRHFGRRKSMPGPVGESWELADLEADQSRVRSGPMSGKSLADLRAEWAEHLLGRVALFEGRFPLLIKFLDAQASLSVQVHPSEAVTRKLGGNVRVKHEAWYILAAQPGGVIYHGLEPGVDAETFREAMLTGRIEGVLRKIDVQPGQCHYLPSGTPHALGAGVFVAEIQTPSDITYRTYDWGRVDPATGQSRDLHLDQAMECIDFRSPSPPSMQKPAHGLGSSATRLVRCDSFVIDQAHRGAGAERDVSGGEPIVWMVLEGSGEIRDPSFDEPMTFGKGDVILLPAAMADIRVRVESPTPMTYLEVTVPHA